MNRFIPAIAGAVMIAGAGLTRPELKYFSPSEFGVWYPFLNNDLLKKLDLFREFWGDSVEISKAKGALGRLDGSGSQHSLFRAADIFPRVGSGYIKTAAERNRAYRAALKAGFTGLGIYTDTSPGNMLHVDVREVRGNNVAVWSRIAGKYVGMDRVLV